MPPGLRWRHAPKPVIPVRRTWTCLLRVRARVHAAGGCLAAALLALQFALTGCRILPKTSGEPSKHGWEHSNLYNHGARYPKLYVEIDSVAGQGPSRDELRELESFLREHCDKPGGITIKVDNVIPQPAVAGRPAELLALEYLNGPPDRDSAFLYILFYNTRLRGKEALTDYPAFSPLPHPIVWIDRSYRFFGNPWPATFRRAILLHEVGHALGLCAADSRHASGGHCTNDRCRMKPSIHLDLRRLITLRNPWTNRALCQDCRDDLARLRQTPANPRFEFWHGYYRRREEGYQVIGVPGMTYVHFGEALAEPSEALAEARSEALPRLIRSNYTGWLTVEGFDPWEHLPALTRFARETDSGLQMIAAQLFDSIASHVETAAKTDPADARRRLSDDLIAAAAPHPPQHARLSQLRATLAAADSADPAGPPTEN